MQIRDIILFWTQARVGSNSFKAKLWNMSGVPTMICKDEWCPLDTREDRVYSVEDDNGDTKLYSKGQIMQCINMIRLCVEEFSASNHYVIKTAEKFLNLDEAKPHKALARGILYYRFLQVSYAIMQLLLVRGQLKNKVVVLSEKAVPTTELDEAIIYARSLSPYAIYNFDNEDTHFAYMPFTLEQPIMNYNGVAARAFKTAYKRKPEAKIKASEGIIITENELICCSFAFATIKADDNITTYMIKRAYVPTLLKEIVMQ